MPYLTLHKQNLHYYENKFKTNAIPLVFVHGAGGRIQSWAYQWQQDTFVRSAMRRRFLTDFPYFMLDLPGHGKSNQPARNTIGGYAEVVDAFIRSMGLQHVVVIGHSMGGAIVQMLALQQPDYLSGMILLGSGGKMVVNDLILGGLLADFPKTVEMIMKFSWHKDAAPMFRRVATEHMLDNAPEIVHGDFVACSQFDILDQLPTIHVPTLVVAGSHDKMMPLSNSQLLVEKMPNAHLAVIEDTGHFMMIEKTASVTRVMIEFLNQFG